MARKKRDSMKNGWDDELLVIHKRYKPTIILSNDPSQTTTMRCGEYLKSEIWRERRRKLRRKNGYKTCSVCSWKPAGTLGAIHIHHAWEKVSKTYNIEKKNWLIPICYKCHNKHHEQEENENHEEPTD